MNKLLNKQNIRTDLAVIADWIEQGSSVLDLGCGNGTLLNYLIRNKGIQGMGIEINIDKMIRCIESGIPVIERDLNERLEFVSDNSYDYVILSQTVQEVLKPELVIDEIMRIGKKAIVSFPNFGNVGVRLGLLLNGMMPKTKTLYYEWYNTPNIHMMTFKDFQIFCKNRNYKILEHFHIMGNKIKKNTLLPNLFSEGCVVLISK